MTRRVIVPFVETQVLFLLIRFGPVDHNRFDRCLQELRIMNVGPGNDNTQGTTIALNDQAALGTVLRTIRRVFPDFVPPKRALPMAASALCHCQSTSLSSSQ